MNPLNVFAGAAEVAWPFRYEGTILFRDLVLGGTPSNQQVAKAWLQTKFEASDDLIERMVATVMAEREVDASKALEIVGDLKLLKGFKRDEVGPYLEGRVLKAAIKEGVAVALAGGHIPAKGAYGKFAQAGARNFVAEHVMVVNNKLRLTRDDKAITEPDGIQQRFVTTYKGTGITYEEFISNAQFDFELITDWEFDDGFWPQVWLKACEQGLGATRSMGFGRFDVIRWDLIATPPKPTKAAKATKAAPKPELVTV
jgi:hypothetical protein